jgi:hypothetical protein
MGGQNYFFAGGAATLTTRLRKMSFRAIMRQDGELFGLLNILSVLLTRSDLPQSNSSITRKTL